MGIGRLLNSTEANHTKQLLDIVQRRVQFHGILIVKEIFSIKIFSFFGDTLLMTLLRSKKDKKV